MRSKLQALGQKVRKRMHEKVTATGKWLKSVVLGYFNYHAVPANMRVLRAFRREVGRLWRKPYAVEANDIA
jgi:RNA-directed DNA polymerase